MEVVSFYNPFPTPFLLLKPANLLTVHYSSCYFYRSNELIIKLILFYTFGIKGVTKPPAPIPLDTSVVKSNNASDDASSFSLCVFYRNSKNKSSDNYCAFLATSVSDEIVNAGFSCSERKTG
jgi:hypothetical protein